MLFELKQAVAAYDFIQKQIEECDQRLQTLLSALPQRDITQADNQTKATPETVALNRKQKRKKPRPDGNAPQFNMAAE